MSWRDTIKKDTEPQVDSSWRNTIQKEPTTSDKVLETLSDVLPSMAEGATWGGSSELYGLGKAAMEAPSSDQPFSALLNKYVKGGQDRLKLAQERSPVTSTISEIAGNIPSTIPLGMFGTGSESVGAARSLLSKVGTTIPEWSEASKLGKLGLGLGQIAGAAGESAILGSVGGFGKAEGDIETKLEGAKEGAKTGATFGGILGTVGTVGKMVGDVAQSAADFYKTQPSAESNIFRKLSRAFELGTKGENLTERSVMKELTNEADTVAKNVNKARGNLGKEIDDSIVSATSRGVQIPTEKLQSTVMSELSGTPLESKITKVLTDAEGNLKSNITPSELNDIRSLVGRETLNPVFGHNASSAYSNIYKIMEDVPELKQSIVNYRNVSSKVGDPLVNEMQTFENLSGKLSDFGRDKDSMINAIRDTYKKAMEFSTYEGTKASDIRYHSKEYFDKLAQFAEENPELYAKTGLPSPKEMYAKFIEVSDKAGILHGVWRGTTEGAQVLNYLASTVFNPYQYAKIAGKAASSVSKVGSFFGLSEADKLAKIQKIRETTSNPSIIRDLTTYEKSNGNKALQNAILFKLLQTKEGRSALEESEQ